MEKGVRVQIKVNFFFSFFLLFFFYFNISKTNERDERADKLGEKIWTLTYFGNNLEF